VEHLFPGIDSDPFPATHDSTHEFKVVDSFRWKRWTFSGDWVYADGKPYTEPIGVQEVTLPNERTIELIELGEKNAIRLPAYHRLDLSVTWDFYVGEKSKANLGVSFFNVYDNKNVWRKEFDVFDDDIIATDVHYLGTTVSGFLNVDLAVASLARKAGPAWYTSDSSNAPSEDSAARKKEEVYDFYGTVESLGPTTLVVRTKWGSKSFVMNDATIRGASDYDPGTLIHVYYKEDDQGESVVTMLVRKIE
jgi:hypothetical protein